MPAALFVYGTLMDARVQRRVSGREFPSQPASLPGFRRYLVVGEAYPGIRPDPEGIVSGRLLWPVGRAALTRLDAYEGALYRREEVEVVLADGCRERAFVYVVQPHLHHRLSTRAWRG
ncbi:MAG: gamma-glutamylcyclotransferase [Gammaproteobacteria bacterium]|nr:gamma-glutamylcyclotransferase [Gammaproteobacteria bacterium]